jgi:hypothetical protein
VNIGSGNSGKWRVIVALLLVPIAAILLHSTTSWAWELSSLDIYTATKEACSQIHEADFHNGLKADELYAGRFPSRKFTQLVDQIRGQSFSAALASTEYLQKTDLYEKIVNDPLYDRALQECYGSDPRPKIYFEATLLRADRAGKIVSGAATLFITRGVGTFLGKVYQWSNAAYRGIQLGIVAWGARIAYEETQKTVEAWKSQKTETPKDRLNQGLDAIDQSVDKDSSGFAAVTAHFNQRIAELQSELASTAPTDPRHRKLENAIVNFSLLRDQSLQTAHLFENSASAKAD